MESVWEKTAIKPQFDARGGKKATDVLIIGGTNAEMPEPAPPKATEPTKPNTTAEPK